MSMTFELGAKRYKGTSHTDLRGEDSRERLKSVQRLYGRKEFGERQKREKRNLKTVGSTMLKKEQRNSAFWTSSCNLFVSPKSIQQLMTRILKNETEQYRKDLHVVKVSIVF